MKVKLSVNDLRKLREHSERVETLPKWADVALEWAEAAEVEMITMEEMIGLLTERVQELETQLGESE